MKSDTESEYIGINVYPPPPPPYFMFIFFKSTFTWEAKWADTGLRFQTIVKTSSVHMQFHLGCI